MPRAPHTFHRASCSPTIALVVFSFLGACGGRETAFIARNESSDVAPSAANHETPMPPPAPPGEPHSRSLELKDGGAPRHRTAGAPQTPALDAADSATLIRSGAATVKVDSLEPALTSLDSMARSLGGWLGNTTLLAGAEQARSATLELKIPAPRFELALRQLAALGTVESIQTSAEDVGEELVDLRARISNSRRLEERLLSLLSTRAGKLEDALSVERELARVREEIERHEGRLRYLRTRTAISTLAVSVHEPLPIVGSHPGASPLGDAIRQAWRNFVALCAAVIASLGFAVPIAIVAGSIWIFVRRLRSLKPTTPGEA